MRDLGNSETCDSFVVHILRFGGLSWDLIFDGFCWDLINRIQDSLVGKHNSNKYMV